MSSVSECDCVEELAEMFDRKISLIRTNVELRKMGEDTVRKLKNIEVDVAELRGAFEDIRAELKNSEDELRKMQNLLDNLQFVDLKLDHMIANLPAAALKPEKEITTSSSSKDNKQPGAAPAKSSKNPAKLQNITVEEFKTVPAYMKGRLRVEQVNKFVAEFNTAVEGKYRLFSLPRKELKQNELKALQKMKSQENADTKGLYFVTADDLREFGKLKLDKTSNNMLTILRHCRKMKEMRGAGVIRYTVVS